MGSYRVILRGYKTLYSLDVIIIGVLLMYLYVRNCVLFERLFLLIYDMFCACRLYLMNCAIEGNGNANLFRASQNVRVCSSKSYHVLFTSRAFF